MITTVEIPTYPRPKKEDVPIIQDPVARSLAKPDACAKPCTMGKSSSTGKVRVRVNNQKTVGRPRRRKRDYRDVRFY